MGAGSRGAGSSPGRPSDGSVRTLSKKRHPAARLSPLEVEEGNPVDIVNPVISDYLLTHCTPPDDLLRELIAETREAFPHAAGMQVSHDEGELLTVLTRLVVARRAGARGVFTSHSSIFFRRGMPSLSPLLA